MFDRLSTVDGLLCKQVKGKGLLIHQLLIPVCLRSLVLEFLHGKIGYQVIENYSTDIEQIFLENLY